MNRKISYIIIFGLVVMGSNTLSKYIPKVAVSKINTATSESKNLASVASSEVATSPVVRVIDGDTIVVEINGAQEKVRLIGVNTPETVNPRKQVECFGKEASAFVKNILSGQFVRLESDINQDDRDKYGRLLRFVFLEDGTPVNKKIIEEGYGHEYTYRAAYQYQAEFKTAERIAREGKRGLWGDVCEKI